MTDIEKRARKERNRVLSLLSDCDVSPKAQELLAPIVENVSWMKAKLDEAREAVKNSTVVVAYNNGGGQSGIRENPLFKGYESLWKSYMSGMAKILEFVPEDLAREEKEEAQKPRTVLQLVRAKHEKSA